MYVNVYVISIHVYSPSVAPSLSPPTQEEGNKEKLGSTTLPRLGIDP